LIRTFVPDVCELSKLQITAKPSYMLPIYSDPRKQDLHKS
jgi:hypothetical protein